MAVAALANDGPSSHMLPGLQAGTTNSHIDKHTAAAQTSRILTRPMLNCGPGVASSKAVGTSTAPLLALTVLTHDDTRCSIDLFTSDQKHQNELACLSRRAAGHASYTLWSRMGARTSSLVAMLQLPTRQDHQRGHTDGPL
jgi:hypothetical protein